MRLTLLRTGNILKVGLKAILRNKMRSSLTMLGIIIGVACVIVVVALISGASTSIQASITSLGTNFIMVMPGAVTQSGARIFTGQSSLSPADADAIKAECPSVAYASPGERTGGQVVAGELNWGTQIQGVGVDWPFIRAWNLDAGTWFSEADVKGAAKVCVLGRTVADNLFPSGGAVGQVVRIKNVPFKVIGVLEKKGSNTMGQDQDDLVATPYTTVMNRLQGHAGHRDRIDIIYVSAVSMDRVQQAQAEIKALLRQRQKLGPGQDDNFMMRSQEEFASMAAQNSRTLSVLLATVAGVSLLVGGIGIMNIMLVSVTERTREIGLRMAIGAKGRHVLAQFLLEAIVLSLLGGIFGMLLGLLVSWIIKVRTDWPVQVGATSVAIAFGFSACVGIFFGFYPARKASRLDPIDALRYE
jgi:putative ABC transport system permease protein